MKAVAQSTRDVKLLIVKLLITAAEDCTGYIFIINYHVLYNHTKHYYLCTVMNCTCIFFSLLGQGSQLCFSYSNSTLSWRHIQWLEHWYFRSLYVFQLVACSPTVWVVPCFSCSSTNRSSTSSRIAWRFEGFTITAPKKLERIRWSRCRIVQLSSSISVFAYSPSNETTRTNGKAATAECEHGEKLSRKNADSAVANKQPLTYWVVALYLTYLSGTWWELRSGEN